MTAINLNNSKAITGKILIVEDDPENLYLLTSLLESSGHTLRHFTKGIDALDFIKSWIPDLVLLDIMLPDITGLELCEILKSNNETKDVPVIFLSAITDSESKMKGFNAGGVDYITKPYLINEVRSRVQVHIESRILYEEYETTVLELKKKNELLQKEIEKRKTEAVKLSESFNLVDGSRIAALNLMEDLKTEVSLRRKNEDALQASEQRFRGFIENVSDIVFTTDTKGLFTYISPNPPEYKRDIAHEAIGKSFVEYLHPDDMQIGWNFINTLLKTGKQQTSDDYRVSTYDGS